MHDNTYFFTNQPQALIKSIHDLLQQSDACGWKVLQYEEFVIDPELPVKATLVLSKIGDDRSCIILHSFVYLKNNVEERSEDKRNFILASPHFLTSYAESHSWSTGELEPLLRDFDEFVETNFANSYSDIKKF